MCRHSLVCVLTAVLIAISAPVDGGEPERMENFGVYTVPSRICGPFFLVPLTLPDKPGYKDRHLTFLFDSGATVSWIDPDTLARISGRKAKAGERVDLIDARAGPLTFRRLAVSVRELDHLARAMGEPFDGILGFTAFRDFLLTVDYPKARLRISHGSLPPPDGREVFDARGPDDRPYLEIRSGKWTQRVLIDTGSATTFALRRRQNMRWRTAPLTVAAFPRPEALELRKAGRMVGQLRFGGHRIENPLVYLTANEMELMGAAALRHFAVTFDQKHRRVRLRRKERAAVELPSLVDTGAILRPRPGGLQVITVLRRSPADAAGLRPGDLIVGDNGRDSLQRGCAPLKGYADGTEVSYEVQRGRETVMIAVRRTVLVE